MDAADLHLVLAPEIERRESYSGGHEAIIDPTRCDGCGNCYDVCTFGAIIREDGSDGGFTYRVDPLGCEGCGVCVRFCPSDAIDFPTAVNGEWYVSSTRHGPLVHARLIPGSEKHKLHVMSEQIFGDLLNQVESLLVGQTGDHSDQRPSFTIVNKTRKLQQGLFVFGLIGRILR